MTAEWKFDKMYRADANKVAEEIKSIGDEAKAEDILEYARNENSELHKCFTWDDTEAAEKYRLQEARNVIRFIVIVDDRIEEEPKKTEIRYFVNTGKQDHSYTQTKLIVQKMDEYQALLERAMAELRAFKQKYANLKELDYILELIK